MSKFKFLPEMFVSVQDVYVRHDAATNAQAALDKHLYSCPIVCRSAATGTFSQTRNDGNETHTAVLFNLELIEKLCEHRLIDFVSCSGLTTEGKCKECGAKLKATWYETCVKVFDVNTKTPCT